LIVKPYRRRIMSSATNRILRELLKKPVVKNSIRGFLNNIDPDNAPELARTIIWQDPEVILSLMGAIPSIANVIIRLLDEIIVQVVEKFPPQLLHDFLESIFQDIDREPIERIGTNLTKLFNDLYLEYDSGEVMKGEKNG